MLHSSRRQFLQLAGAVGVTAAALEVFRIRPAEASGCAAPPSFPTGIDLYQEAYRNWAGDIVVDGVWTCAPTSAGDLVTVANWAHANGYRVRARGMRHGWSPLTLAAGESCDTQVVLLDMTQHLTTLSRSGTTVTAQAGATLDALLTYAEGQGLGVLACPAPGDITVGGALAIDAHGSAVPAVGESRPAGKTYGSLSNLVLSMQVVTWDGLAYSLKTVTRTANQAGALLTHLGRSLVAEVTLQLGSDARLRCQSWTDVPITEVLAAPGSSGRTVQSLLDSTGRMEVIWFPFTDYPWLKAWSVSPTQPLTSREVTSPYNYPFSDNVPDPLVQLAHDIVTSNPSGTPTFCRRMYDVVDTGLVATQSDDIWGWSKNTLFYVKPTTMRVHANGYALHCKRSDVQRIVHEFYVKYAAMVADYQSRGLYPVNMPVEIRATGLDDPGDVGVPGAVAPTLSALRAWPAHPEWDTVVWIDVLCLTGTPGAMPFFHELEQWALTNYASYVGLRVEWSKGWAYTDAGPWRDTAVIGTTVPVSFTDTGVPAQDFAAAVSKLDSLDPFRVFTTDLLDRLLH